MIDQGKEIFYSIYKLVETEISRVTLKVFSKKNWGGQMQIVLSRQFLY
jgi:hypothetical protein